MALVIQEHWVVFSFLVSIVWFNIGLLTAFALQGLQKQIFCFNTSFALSVYTHLRQTNFTLTHHHDVHFDQEMHLTAHVTLPWGVNALCTNTSECLKASVQNSGVEYQQSINLLTWCSYCLHLLDAVRVQNMQSAQSPLLQFSTLSFNVVL